jgi:hypothetical protein
MTYMSNTRDPRSTRRWAWANRPFEPLDNPVRRWLGNRSKGRRLQERHRPQILQRLIVRPAV